MFVANAYVDVYRALGDPNYSEYDTTATDDKSLVDVEVPIHITPFAPKFTDRSQSTSIIANTRRNHVLRKGDELRAKDGRVFVVDSVEGTDGAFMGNSIIYRLIENDAVV